MRDPDHLGGFWDGSRSSLEGTVGLVKQKKRAGRNETKGLEDVVEEQSKEMGVGKSLEWECTHTLC